MDGGSDCHSSNGTIWSRLTRFFGREDDESLEKAIIEARADGEVEPDEESMLLGILRFNDLQVQDTMTPRTDIDCVPEDMLLPEVARVIVESGHSRIPVFRDTRDNMVGMLHAKDILSCLLDPKMADQPASAIMREPFFVPETKPIRNLLQEFRASKQHIAQLFTHQHRVIQVQCVHSLIRFFQEVHPNRCMGLNFIPRTAVDRISQKGDNVDKIICRVRAVVRIFHACCNAACPGCTRVRLKKQQATSYLSFYRFVKETIQVAV